LTGFVQGWSRVTTDLEGQLYMKSPTFPLQHLPQSRLERVQANEVGFGPAQVPAAQFQAAPVQAAE
jgi:hypothetical protein